jgi:hypothetical protein
MRRIIMLATVALVMAAMMLAMALPAFAQGGATVICGPPGQTIRQEATVPDQSTPEAFEVVPGQRIKDECAPGQLKM